MSQSQNSGQYGSSDHPESVEFALPLPWALGPGPDPGPAPGPAPASAIALLPWSVYWP